MPEKDTSVVVLAAAPDVLTTEVGDRSPLSGISSIVDGQGTHGHFDLDTFQQIQTLRIDATAAAAPLVAIVPLDITGFDRLEAINRLLAALHGRAIPRDTRLTRQQRVRARRMLQAFDGARDGATQLEIAQVIFRVGSITRDQWQVSSTRHAVMSLLRDARAMIGGGYRKLLRHRHRR
ncbi:MAG: DUF2285 domain-containing protein [Hyphomicrobiaceae bacterium]